MADIRDAQMFLSGRWDWDRLGYGGCFPSKVSFGDVDALIERRHRFLFIENKSLNSAGQATLQMPKGQEIALTRLALLPGVVGLLIAGDAATGDPHKIKQIGTDLWFDLLADENLDNRKQYLRDVFTRWWEWAESGSLDPFLIPQFEAAPF